MGTNLFSNDQINQKLLQTPEVQSTEFVWGCIRSRFILVISAASTI
jgi:hypothetical protein